MKCTCLASSIVNLDRVYILGNIQNSMLIECEKDFFVRFCIFALFNSSGCGVRKTSSSRGDDLY